MGGCNPLYKHACAVGTQQHKHSAKTWLTSKLWCGWPHLVARFLYKYPAAFGLCGCNTFSMILHHPGCQIPVQYINIHFLEQQVQSTWQWTWGNWHLSGCRLGSFPRFTMKPGHSLCTVSPSRKGAKRGVWVKVPTLYIMLSKSILIQEVVFNALAPSSGLSYHIWNHVWYLGHHPKRKEKTNQCCPKWVTLLRTVFQHSQCHEVSRA